MALAIQLLSRKLPRPTRTLNRAALPTAGGVSPPLTGVLVLFFTVAFHPRMRPPQKQPDEDAAADDVAQRDGNEVI